MHMEDAMDVKSHLDMLAVRDEIRQPRSAFVTSSSSNKTWYELIVFIEKRNRLCRIRANNAWNANVLDSWNFAAIPRVHAVAISWESEPSNEKDNNGLSTSSCH